MAHNNRRVSRPHDLSSITPGAWLLTLLRPSDKSRPTDSSSFEAFPASHANIYTDILPIDQMKRCGQLASPTEDLLSHWHCYS